jgi:cation diffusion facilitator CzcD-associated flavoprotein CzcO
VIETPVLIVGAGPYGLGIAQELWHRGRGVLAVGEPFELWRNHTMDSMFLRSSTQASTIYSRDRRYDFERFLARRSGAPRGRRARVPVGLFREYLAEVEANLPFPLRRGRVEQLERAEEGTGFTARLSDGTLVRAEAVVVATGIGGHRYLPPEVAQLAVGLPPGRVLHSWEVRTIEVLAGERILVIGTGQSAGEAVDHLRARNRVTWVLRHAPLFLSEPLRLPTPLFRLVLAASPGLYRLPRFARHALAGAFFHTTMTPALRPAHDDPAVAKVHAEAAELELAVDGDEVVSKATGERFDRVIAATGYCYSLAGLPFLGERLRGELGDELPALDRSFATKAPGFHLAGGIAESAFGPAQRFILGSWHAARRIGRALGS